MMGVVRSSQLQKFFCRTIETCWLLLANDSEQGSKDGWLGSPPRIPIVAKKEDRLDLLDLGEKPRGLS